MTKDVDPHRGDDGMATESENHRLATLPVAGVGAALVVHNVLIHRILPDPLHSLARAVTTGSLYLLSRAAGATRKELGLDPDTFGRGIKYGSAAATAVGGGIFAVMVLPAGRRYLARSAPPTMSKRRMAYDTAIRIPWMTAAFEEFAFRGALFGLLEHRFNQPVALAGSTVGFALWHVLPALPGSGGVQDSWETPRPGLAVLGSVAVTGVAGLAFGLLRIRSGSVLAPFIAHSATNVGGYTGAIAARAITAREGG